MIDFPVIKTITVFVFILFFCEGIQAQDIAINEAMASNAFTIADEDGDFEDWIELYNYGTTSINLNGYGLSDNYDDPFKWVFPAVVIHPGDFLLVWASGKDRRDPDLPLHTNYSISSAGEEVILTSPNSIRLDEMQPITIPTDVSYGRQPDGTGQWFYFGEPTPGASNDTESYSEILSPPVFSHNGGFYTEEFELIITHSDPEVTICYTLDGSIPDIDNLGGTIYHYKNQYPENPGDLFGDTLSNSYQSHFFTHPIFIYDRSPEPDRLTQISSTQHANPHYFPSSPVRKGTVVTARAFKEGALPSALSAHTYFVFHEGNPYNIPVISLITQENHLFEYYDGIYTAGVDFDTWRIENPDFEGSPGPVGNFRRRGIEWEYPVNFEVFANDNTELTHNQGLGFRIHGGWSRYDRQKNLRLYARNRYDIANEITYDFFEQSVTFSTIPNNTFRRLTLRYSGAGGIGRPYLADVVSNVLMQPVFEGVTRVQPAVHFINGEFWGITSFRDRFDQYHYAYNYNLDPDNIIILAGIYGQGSEHNIDAGNIEDLELYRDFYNYVIDNEMSDSVKYQEVLNMLDVKSYVDYLIMRIYLSDDDWGGSKHFAYWRVREPSDTFFGDGKWRVYTWDFDRAGEMQRLHTNLLHEATTNWATDRAALLKNLLESPIFNAYFINRFADHINTTFRLRRILEVMQSELLKIQPYLSENHHRWSINIAPDDRTQEYLDYCFHRPAIQRQHIREHFSIDHEHNITLDVNNPVAGYIRINTIDITPDTPGVSEEPYPWTGIYFNNIPFEVEAIAHNGYAFSHWEGMEEDEENSIMLVNPTQDLLLTAHFIETGHFEPDLLYFWAFDTSIPNNTPLELLNASYSLPGEGLLTYHSSLIGYPFDPSHPNWRKASLERRNAPTAINYRPEGYNDIPYNSVDMRGLQVRQPFRGDAGENTLYLHLPSTDYQDLLLQFAVKDEGAANELIIDYSASNTEADWISDGLAQNTLTLYANYRLHEVDFSGIDAVNDNPSFVVRIRFEGNNMAADNGNRVTFNNISLEGKPIVDDPKPGDDNDNDFSVKIFPNPTDGLVFVELNKNQAADTYLSVYCMMGELIVRERILGDFHAFDALTTMASGVYIFRIEHNSEIVHERVVRK